MFRVASYNIRKSLGTDRRRSPQRILDVLREVDADIVALQEADARFGSRKSTLPRDLIEQAGYSVVAVAARPGSIGWHGNALLVRNAQIRDSQRLVLPVVEPRGAVLADLDMPHGRMRVVGMHLDLSGIRRRRQGRAILAALNVRDSCPTIVMGDTNEWRSHAGCIADFSHRFQIAPTGPSFHSRRPIARLDRIMVDHALTIVDCGVHCSALAIRASDHLPIWADIDVDATTR